MVSITVLNDNTGKTERLAYITFTDENNNERQLTVEQKPTPRMSYSGSNEITIPQIGSVNSTNIYISTNFGITPSNNGNDWIDFSQEDASYGRIKLYINVEDAATAERTGTITITSNYNGSCEAPAPITLTVTQIYEETPEPEKRDIVWLHKEQTSERKDPLEITVAANARDNIEFYIECNDNARVRERTLNGSETQDITIRETNGYDVSNGETISPTGLVDDGYSPRKLIATIPANTAMGEVENERTFKVKFATVECSQLDARHCRTELKIVQRGNSWIDSDYRIDRFFLEDVMHDGQTSVELEADSYTFVYNGQNDTSLKTYLDVECIRHDAAGTQSADTRVDNYIAAGGAVDSNYLSITFKDSNNRDVNWIYVASGYVAVTDYPYAIGLYANTGYTTGNSRECDMTVTYMAPGIIGGISKTIHITQKYRQVEPAELAVNLYSQHTPSGTATGKELEVRPSNGYVYFDMVKDASLPVKYMYNMYGEDANYYIDFSQSMFDGEQLSSNDFEGEEHEFNSDHPSNAMFSIKLTENALNDLPFDIGIYAWKTTDERVNTELKVTVVS